MVFRKLSVTRRPSVGWVFLPETEMFPTLSLRVPLELARLPQFFAWQNISSGPASERLCWSWMPPTIEELTWSGTRSKCLRSRKWHYPKAEFPMGSNILYTDLLIFHLKLSNYSVANIPPRTLVRCIVEPRKCIYDLLPTLSKGRHKIIILDEADSMTEAAQQALRWGKVCQFMNH